MLLPAYIPCLADPVRNAALISSSEELCRVSSMIFVWIF